MSVCVVVWTELTDDLVGPSYLAPHFNSGCTLCRIIVLDCVVTWIHGYLRRADQNHDGKMSYEEVQTLLQMINIDLSEQYASTLFKVGTKGLVLFVWAPFNYHPAVGFINKSCYHCHQTQQYNFNLTLGQRHSRSLWQVQLASNNSTY